MKAAFAIRGDVFFIAGGGNGVGWALDNEMAAAGGMVIVWDVGAAALASLSADARAASTLAIVTRS